MSRLLGEIRTHITKPLQQVSNFLECDFVRFVHVVVFLIPETVGWQKSEATTGDEGSNVAP